MKLSQGTSEIFKRCLNTAIFDQAPEGDGPALYDYGLNVGSWLRCWKGEAVQPGGYSYLFLRILENFRAAANPYYHILRR